MIAEEAFRPVYQPIVDLRTGEAVGFEALTRFAAGAPDRVFGDAWATGLGIALETATLRAAVAGARDLPPGGWLSVNVSPAYVLDDHRLAGLLAEADRPIVIEITEHSRVDDYIALRSALEPVRPRARIAVDDAGAGIANFGHLVELAPDIVKADIGLVRGIDADPTRRAMIAGLRHFIHEIGGSLIAEGIETEDEREALLALDIRHGQGYLFGRPAEAVAWR
jgi:EAL domain-containing protein (putative c-di-GMP-specific phosphodiesterase class I)